MVRQFHAPWLESKAVNTDLMPTPQEHLWHYSDGATSFGPLGSTVIRQLVTAGVIHSNFTLRRDGEETWTLHSEVDVDTPPKPKITPPPPPPFKSDVSYHLARNGETSGPFQTAEIREMVLRREITTADQVWAEGMSDWTTISHVPDLHLVGDVLLPSPAAKNPPAIPAHPTTPQAHPVEIVGRNQGVTMLLTILTLGIYSWYLVATYSAQVSSLTCRKRLEFTPIMIFSILTLGMFAMVYQVILGYDLHQFAEHQKKPLLNGSVWWNMLLMNIFAALIQFGSSGFAIPISLYFTAQSVWMLQRELNVYATKQDR